MIELNDIVVRRGQRVVFAGLSRVMKSGSLTLVKGANGCGKTSLLRLLAGLLSPSAGEMRRDFLPEDLIYVSHKNGLYPELTVAEHLDLWGEMLGELQTKNAAVVYFGLEKWLDQKVSHLSAGWQRRVGLCRLMIAPKRRIWLLDEPLVNLDAAGKEAVLGLIAVCCDQGGVVVMTAHEELDLPMGDVLELADYAVH